MKVTIVVTQRDIDFAVPNDPSVCPIAQALMFAGFGDPHVGYDTIEFTTANVAYKTPTPPDVCRRLNYYDTEEGGMEPFEFEVEAVEQ